MPTSSLTTIAAVKNDPITYQPLLLARIIFKALKTEKTITGASNTSPVTITCSSHGYTTGDVVSTYGIQGNAGANGRFIIDVTGTNTFQLRNSVGTGTYTSGGNCAEHYVLRLSSHGLNTLEGGYQYDSQDWYCRLRDVDMIATQALSTTGIDRTPSITIQVADADSFVWTNFVEPYGLKGATIELVFVFWDVDTSTFSDERTVYVGRLDALTASTAEYFSVKSYNELNLALVQLPQVRIQKRCPWSFPATKKERQEGADNEASPFWNCGYSPDASGPNAVGDLVGGVPATTCARTKAECQARGMYLEDGSLNQTARFGGFQWAPVDTHISRGFITGKWEEIQNNGNEAKWGDRVPEVYGAQRIQPPVLNVTGDGNLTKMEVLICRGEMSRIFEVLVNDTRIAHASDDALFMTDFPEGGNTTSGWWKTVNAGTRTGQANPDTLYDSKGDPYGGYSVITIVVPVVLAAANSVPNVEVYLRGPALRVYTAVDTYSKVYTENPAWHMLDLLVKCGWTYDRIDIQSFIDAAAHCDEYISFKNQFGSTVTHNRYTSASTLRRRQSASDVVRSLRTSFKAGITPDFGNDGRLRLYIEGTLHEQQGSSNPESNNTSPISSFEYDGSVANGYSYWDFSEADYVAINGKSSFSLVTDDGRAPNRADVQFQNRYDRHVLEKLGIIDTEDLSLVDEERPAGLDFAWADNFDQMYRTVNTFFAKGFRGNNRLSAGGALIGDTGGTIIVEFTTTFKAVHLRVGDLCRVSHQRWGLANQLVRILKIKPSIDFKTVEISAAFHNDRWYLDTFGQEAQPPWRPSFRNKLIRGAFPWSANAQAPETNDAWFDATDKTFAVTPGAETLADGSPISKIMIGGDMAINTFSTEPEPPYVDIQGSTASTGGSIEGGQVYFIAICAKDVAGSSYKPSVPSRYVTIAVPAGTNTNTLTATGIIWDSVAAGYVIFAGTNPQQMTYQGDGDTTPSSITLTDFNVRSWGMPDQEFDRMRFKLKRIFHAGVFGAEVVSVTSTTMKLAVLTGTNAGFVTNEWAGYDLTLFALVDDDGPVPIANWTVASNTSDTLTFSAGPDPTAITRSDGSSGLVLGDIVVMRSVPNVSSDATGNFIEDAKWINNLNQLESPVVITNATNASPIAVTTLTDHGYTTGDRIYVNNVGGNTAANGLWTVTVTGSKAFTLGGSTGSAAYTSGGLASRMVHGFIDNSRVGDVIRFVKGPGKGTTVKIKSNIETGGKERFYIDGEWPQQPDINSRYIIEESNWQSIQETTRLNNSTFDAPVTHVIEIDNYHNRTLLVQAVTLDGGDTPSVEFLSPVREFWNFGTVGATSQGGDNGWATIASADVITPELSDGLTEAVVLDRALTTIEPATYLAAVPNAGFQFTIKVIQDATGGRQIAWNAAYKDASLHPPDEQPEKVSTYNFVTRPDGNFDLNSVQIGTSNT